MTDSVSVHPATGLRCSDADRERTGERLRDAAGEGCLTMDEFDDRLAGVYSARYRQELDALVTDLPTIQPSTGPAGWRAVLSTVWAQLGADAALLLGRGGPGWTRRRIVLAVLVLVLVFAGFIVASALHGLGGGGGIERHGGFQGPPFDGPRHHF